MTAPLPGVPNALPPPNEPLRLARVKAYTLSPTRRLVQRLAGLFVVLVSALGLDVSYWQTFVTWLTAKNKLIQFAFIRALYGLTVDAKLVTHWGNAKAAGVKRGAYLYYLDALDPLAQAQKLYDTLAATGDLGDLPPVLDVEKINNSTLTAAKIKLCLEELTKLFGKKPIIYTGFYVWRDNVIGEKGWAVAYKLWIAAYPLAGWADDYPVKVLNYPPPLPWPFTAFYLWQWTASAPAVSYGVSGNFLDLDHASPEFVSDYFGETPPPIPPPPAGDDTLRVMKCLKPELSIRIGGNQSAQWIGNLKLNNTYLYLPERTVFNGTDDVWWAIPNPVPGHLLGYAAHEHPTLTGPGLEDVAAFV